MRKLSFLTVLALLTAISFTSCKKMGPLSADYFKVDPAVLEAKGGKVEATITGTFPEEYVKKKAVITVVPVLKYNGTEEKLQTKTFQGEKVKGNDEQISYKMGGTYTHKISCDFKQGMEKAELFLQFEVKVGKKTVTIPEVKIADGVNTTYMLAKADVLEPMFSSDEFQRTIIEQQEAQINFLVNQANIRSSELKKEDMIALGNKLKEINKEKESKSISGVEVLGYASPEGTVEFNTSLAEKREKVAADHINKEMKKLKESAQIDSKYTPEDWEGFQKLVASSSIQDKDLILSVLSNYSDPNQREVEIRKLSAAFKALETDILPQLRRSKLKLTYEITGKTDDQLIAAATTDPSSLTVEELLFSATLISDLSQKAAIYTSATQTYPNDYRGFNNLGATNYLQGDLAAAEQAFAKAASLSPSAKEVSYNSAIINLRKGDIKSAEALLGKSAGLGAKVDAALGVVYLYKGDYAAANNAMSVEKSNNAAVAKLVTKNTSAATAILNDVKAPDATTAYLKAIVAARLADKNNVYANLREAVKDSNLKKRAATDIEFAKYNTEEAFTQLIK
jgi:Flp pilus assembly protein TadD/outer membrane protein OmpA-like peptidoglycan-associated protein